MSDDLILTTPGRPAILAFKGGSIYIGVHDQHYLAEIKRLRQQMYDAHPDRRWFTGVRIPHGRGGIKPGSGNASFIPLSKGDAWKGRFNKESTVPFLAAKSNLDGFIAREAAWYAQYGMTPPPVHGIEHKPVAPLPSAEGRYGTILQTETNSRIAHQWRMDRRRRTIFMETGRVVCDPRDI